MRRISGLLLILLISFCGGNEIVEDPITTTTSMMTLEEYEKGWIEKLEIYPVLTKDEFDTVSYTHLTLPTILPV